MQKFLTFFRQKKRKRRKKRKEKGSIFVYNTFKILPSHSLAYNIVSSEPWAHFQVMAHIKMVLILYFLSALLDVV